MAGNQFGPGCRVWHRMPTRRISRGSGAGLIPLQSISKNTGKFDQSENEFTENEDSNRMSGAFESEPLSKSTKKDKSGSKNKFGGSLFAAKIVDEPRRRGTNESDNKLLPMKKTKAVPMKIVKKAPAPLVSESEFDNMSDMFGTSPMVKTAPPKAFRPTERKTPTKPAINKRQTMEKTPLKNQITERTKPVAEKSAPKPVVSAPKPAVSPVKKAAVPRPQEDDDLSARFEDLQRRFEQLNMLRTTNAEKLMAEYKRSAETRDHAAQKLIESLKNENSLLKERVESQTRSRRDSNVSVMSTTSVGTSIEAQNIIELYKNLCGLSMETLEENKWSCTVEGRHGSYSFELEYDADQAEYTYLPVFTKESTVWERLPGYLKEEIIFGEGYLQSFFWRALNFLMSQ